MMCRYEFTYTLKYSTVPSNIEIAFGSSTHEAILALQANNWILNDKVEGLDILSSIKFKDAIRILPVIKHRKIQDISRLFGCWEWLNPDFNDLKYIVPQQSDDWQLLPISDAINNNHANIDWSSPEFSLFQMTKKELCIASPSDFITGPNCEYSSLHSKHKYFDCIQAILQSKSPIIVATDGALRHPKATCDKSVSSAFVICILDIRSSETIKSGEWTHRPAVPLLSRCSLLPNSIGANDTDVASAECHAFLSQELCIPSFLPRITITDSEAVRDQVLQARNCESMVVDRKLLRSTIGGIGKSIMGTLADIIHKSHIQTSISSACTANPLLAKTIQTLTHRNREFLTIAETWTKEYLGKDTAKNTKMDDAVGDFMTWRTEYLDKDDFRIILKVNSHQLDDEGLSIKRDKRYANLVPNLSMLNANHIADVAADIPNSPRFHNINMKKHICESSFSPLRFEIIANGLSIDKHVSIKLQNLFNDEKIKRLKTKHTQGLLWRLFSHIDIEWDTIKNNKGLHRSLLGLSRTHSRSLYKSGNYREGLFQEYLETLSEDKDRVKAKKFNVKDKIKLLCSCKWCPKFSPQASEHGNRLHALLHCRHKDLDNFRYNARELINSEFKELFRIIEEYTSAAAVVTFLKDVQDVFLKLQHLQIGRLTKVPTSSNKSYASIAELLEKYESTDILSCIQKEKEFVSLELFGVIPQNTISYLSDANIGAVDAPWLGMYPKTLGQVVNKVKAVIKDNIAHLENRYLIIEAFDNKWKLIQGVTMGMAMGLHRIIGTIGHSLEKSLQAKYNLDQYTFKVIKANTSPTKSKNPPQNGSNAPNFLRTCVPCNNATEPHTKASHQQKRDCAGITCNANKVNWKIFKNFTTSNKIATNIKHCTRCARQSSAIRLAAQIINEFITNREAKQTKDFSDFLLSSSCDKIAYRPLMHLLHHHYSKFRQNNEAKYIRKNFLTDANKLVCRAIVQVHTLELSKGINITSRLQGMHERLVSTLSRSEDKVEDGRSTFKETEIILERILQQRKIEENQESISTLPLVEDQQRQHYVREALTTNGLLSSMGIRRAIEVFRSRRIKGCYFANAEATEIMDDWSATQGWERAARMFGSQEVICNKPDGFYFIPIFEGSVRSGHWTVMIIKKRGRFKRGYTIDSLGISSHNGRIHDKISELFQGTNGRFDWITCTTRRQSEVECGPRVINSIHEALESIHRGETFKNVILEATLLRRPHEDYDVTGIREKAAQIISSFLPRMWTNPVRVDRTRATGKRITNFAADTTPRKRKRRRKRGKQRMTQTSTPTQEIVILSE